MLVKTITSFSLCKLNNAVCKCPWNATVISNCYESIFNRIPHISNSLNSTNELVPSASMILCQLSNNLRYILAS